MRAPKKGKSAAQNKSSKSEKAFPICIKSGLVTAALIPPSPAAVTATINTGKSRRQTAFFDAKQSPVAVKQRTVVTPWRDTVEFIEVYDWLFSRWTTPSKQRQALSRMRVWSLRRGSLCPAAVLATSVLVKAQLEDKQGNTSIQTTYASAFTRFFNFMSSIMQGYNRSTMYETARQLSLQSFIVDLRHLCAHGQELPPAEVLRNTSVYCLQWLRDYYWIPHCGTMRNLDAARLRPKDKTQFDNDVTSLFEMYDLALECHLKGAQKLKAVHKLKSSADFNKIRQYFSTKKLKTIRDILDAVVDDLNAFVKRAGSSMKDLLDIYIASFFKMKYFFAAGLKHTQYEELIVEASQGLFQMLARQGFIDNVFIALIQLIENTKIDEAKRKGASYWALKLVETFTMLSKMKRMYKEELDLNSKFKTTDFSSLNTRVVSKTMRTLLIHSGVDQSCTLVFGDSLKKPQKWVFERAFIQQRLGFLNKYSVPVIKGLLPLADPAFTESQVAFLIRLCKTISDDDSVQTDEESEQSLDLDPMEQMLSTLLNDKKSSFNNSDGPVFGIWKLEKDNALDWSSCALGVLPWKK